MFVISRKLLPSGHPAGAATSSSVGRKTSSHRHEFHRLRIGNVQVHRFGIILLDRVSSSPSACLFKDMENERAKLWRNYYYSYIRTASCTAADNVRCVTPFTSMPFPRLLLFVFIILLCFIELSCSSHSGVSMLYLCGGTQTRRSHSWSVVYKVLIQYLLFTLWTLGNHHPERER